MSEHEPSHETQAGAVADALEQARPDDPAGLALARARVAGALFGGAVGFGRFHVMERLGRGGMGVVYAAYDPELDRGVALKMVHVAGDRELALGEAKALARLSHPNVVPIYDVGIIDDHVYLVMELVRGATLREWIANRSRRERLEVYRQAGLALAAAHAAGLVHRDFKPENAIVGSDGRVRVVDFGLACETTAPDTSSRRRVGGTPKYMAPEQATGAVSPAADQYSFCVALDEALRSDADDPPGWIAAILERGRASDPAARFPAMADLLHALGRDPARVWRRRIAIAAAAAVALTAFFVGRARSATAIEPCSGADRELAAAWEPTARDAELARIARLSSYGATLAPHLRQQLADHDAQWIAGHRDACLAHRRGVQSDQLLDRRMACLARSKTALATIADITRAADAHALPDVARAASSLPDPRQCGDLDALALDIEPPAPALALPVATTRAELERARVQLAAGRAAVAHALADRAVASARTLGYQPLVAEALLVDGQTQMSTDPPRAATTLRDATQAGIAAGSDAVAVEAWARRAYVEGTTGDPSKALAGLEVIDALAARTKSSQFARALLYNNVGSVELARDHRSDARAAFERAIAIARDVTGPGAIELVAIRRNLQLVLDDRAERDRLLASVEADLVRVLGEGHPDVLLTRLVRATSTLDGAEAARLLAPTCESLEQHDGIAFYVAPCWAELAELRIALADAPGALAAADRAIARGAATNPLTYDLAGNARLWRGDATGALADYQAQLAKLAPVPDEPWFRRYERAKLVLGIGAAQRALGKRDAARTSLTAAVDDLAAIARDHAQTANERRLVRARRELAAVTADSPR
ncbi:MAG TPA: serine/threonine-protein kinase [Kofleriaceae bacterium]|nr:serine/threonine-protein kinase [Kofleriaceae bacterium]